MNSKIKKKLFFSIYYIICIIVIVVILEIIIYNVEARKLGWTKIKMSKPVYTIFAPDFSIKNFDNPLRNPCGLEYNKPPIVIYGCSFSYGHRLHENDHFGYVLSKYIKRPVYNLSVSGTGLQHVLYIIQTEKPIEPKPDQAIYVMMFDHVRRMYMPGGILSPTKFLEYKNKNGKLVLRKDLFGYLKNTMTGFYILSKVVPLISEERRYNLMKLYLKEIKEELDKKYPGIKFTVIIYDNKSFHPYLTKDKKAEIEKMGIDLIDLDDYFGNALYQTKYKLNQGDYHPNAKAWKVIVPEFVKIEKM